MKIEELSQDTKSLAKRVGSPKFRAMVNGVETIGIFDGGSTSCLISLELVRQLGVQSLKKTSTVHLMADGTRSKALGIACGLKLEIIGVLAITINATVFDQNDYSLLIGRHYMEATGVGTDWFSNFWYYKKDDRIVPISVFFDNEQINQKMIIGNSSEEDSDDSSDQYEDSEESEVSEKEKGAYCAGEDEEEVVRCYWVAGEEMENDTAILENEEPTSRESLQEKLIENVRRNCVNLCIEEQNGLLEVLSKHLDAFGMTYGDMNTTDLLEFEVNTGETEPVVKKPNYHMNAEERKLLRKEINTTVIYGLMEPAMRNKGSKGAWGFPCMFVGKKGGKKWLVVMFQGLNAVTASDYLPVPLLNEVLENYAGCKYFTSVDMIRSFHQIRVAKGSVEKLTVNTPWGAYSYKCMPFGLKNASFMLARVIHLALEEFIPNSVNVYIDDTSISSKTFDEHLVIIDKVLARMEDVKFKLHPDKCRFAAKEIDLLGFKVGEEGISVNPDRLKRLWNILDRYARKTLERLSIWWDFLEDIYLNFQELHHR